MNIKKNSIFILILILSKMGFADTISENLIFSEDIPIGAAICSDIQADGYCEKSVPTYSSEGIDLKNNEKLQGACIKGGGDCLMVTFILKTKTSKTDKILALVKNEKQKELWVQIPKTAIKNIDELIPELGTGENNVAFRPGLKLYQDKDLTKLINITDISKNADNKNIDPNKEGIEFVELSTFKKGTQKIIELQINLIKKDLNLIDTDPLKSIENGVRIKLRKIFFPAKDEKGRINYWYQPQSC